MYQISAGAIADYLAGKFEKTEVTATKKRNGFMKFRATKPTRDQAIKTEILLQGIGVKKTVTEILSSRYLIAVDEEENIVMLGEMTGLDQANFWLFRADIGRKQKTKARVAITSNIFRRNTWKNITIQGK